MGTGLGRSGSPIYAAGKYAVVRSIMRFMSRFQSAMYPGTPERAGEALAQLALGAVVPPPDRVYASLVRGEIAYPDPAPLAASDDARDRLWRESATMVGL